ncbi:MAG: DUF5615 family PIN-like protein [Dichotomicrobium sp.]
MMRFLADENFPGEVVEALRQGGHDVAWMANDDAGEPDSQVLRRALDEGRVILTFDKDFGELARGAQQRPDGFGVVLFRLRMPLPSLPALATLIDARDDWPGHFSVIEPGRVRMRPLG